MPMVNNTDVIAYKNVPRFRISSLMLVWLLSLGFYFHQYMFRIIPSIAVPAMNDSGSAHLSSVQFNVVLFIFWIAFVCFQPVAGLIINRLSYLLTLLVVLLLHIIAILLLASSRDFYVMSLALLLMGIASSFALVFSLFVAKKLFKQTLYPLASGLIFGLGGVAAILASLLFMPLSKTYGPSYALQLFTVIPSILAITMLILLFFQIRHGEPITHPIDHIGLTEQSTHSHATNHPNLAKSYAYVLFHGLPMVSFYSSWLLPFMSDKLGASNIYAKSSTAAVFVGYIIGSPFAGWLTTTFYQTRSILLTYVSGLGLFISALVIYSPTNNVTTLLLLCFLGVVSGFIVTSVSITADLAPAEKQSFALSINSVCSNLGGALALLFIAGLFKWFDMSSLYPDLKEFHIMLFLIPLSYGIAMCIGFSMIKSERTVTNESSI
ncbi:MFS transporter [Shewanella surugensis]|uniref:MFS transporter n=1 Tax=Shewanella surugensis TaxID=212020 RepID=A0ABT0L6C6_9GAMM|nr:MFS transporter [Shewanella surugensis]MCL1123242.1 MFS transporter [Shewanella surugensis]